MPIFVGVGARVVSNAAGMAGPGGPAMALRFAGAENRYPVSTFTALTTKLSFFIKRTFHIGSADVNGFVVAFCANRLGGTGDNATSGYTVVKCAIERVSPAQYQPVLFSGAQGITINSGDSDIHSDMLLPSAFGLAKFTVGDIYVVRIEMTTSAAGNTLPAIESIYVAQSTDYDISYDPGTGTVGPAYGTGAPVVTATTFTFLNTAKFAVNLLGMMLASAKVVLGIGDSIMSGKNQIETDGFIGIFGRSLKGPDGNTATAVLAGCNFGLSGSTSSLWTTAPKAQSMFKYANIMVEEYGTNGTQTAAQMTLCQGLWAAMHALGGKVIRTMLIAETTSTQPVSALSGDGVSLATATVASTFVDSIGTVGATRVCTISGATPAGFNGNFTVTVATATTVTYPNTTAGAATGTILISDQWATEVNQTKVSNWQPGGTVDLWNQSLVTQKNANAFEALVDFSSVTKSTGGDRYLWITNGTPFYAISSADVPVATHPSVTLCIPCAVIQRAAIDAL